ncbi:MAG: ribose 5-phosphate isomerase B [Phycisphaerales bacterium]|nr:MAG: ribose 5-phosphate isomerase B [Phycisphaerales bacterium]
MKIGFGCDHRGLGARGPIMRLLARMGHECVDFGTDSDNPVDYPDIAYLVTRALVQGQVDRGILVCATGMGMCLAANKVRGARATFCHDELSARTARHHNHANVLCLSADQTSEVLRRKIIEVWLQTETGGGRHARRIRKIAAIEEGRDPRTVK